MSENKNNEAVIACDNTEPSTAKSTEIDRSKSSKKSKLVVCIAVLALFLVILVSALGIYFYQTNQRLNSQQQQSINQLNQQLSALKKSQQTLSKKALASQSNLQAQLQQSNVQFQQVKKASKLYQTDVQALQRALAETKVRHPNDWILSEVDYLIKLAGKKIWLENDIGSAIALLAAADQRVVELNDPSLTPLRGALLEDIGTLEALPKRDPDGLVLAFSALERRVNKLIISDATLPETTAKRATEISSDVLDWKENLTKSWRDFVDSFIVINKRDVRLQALLSPEQSWYLQENLRHALAKAEFAIYREQQGIYNLAVANAAELLKNYYDLTDNGTLNFYKSVQRLSERKISVDYPDQLTSMPLLERIIEQRVKKSLASSRVEQE